MQIFTVEMLVVVYKQSRDVARDFFGAALGAAWQNIASLPSAIHTNTINGDWRGAVLVGLLLFSGIVLLYCLVRKNLWMTIRSILGQ